jgi:hypothetical protein
MQTASIGLNFRMARCIESAQTHRARVCSSLTRASDTTLRHIVTNRAIQIRVGI